MLSKILNKDIKEKKDTYQLVCQKCFKLLRDFDNLENKVSEIKHVILDMRRGALKDKEDETEKKNKFSGEPSVKVWILRYSLHWLRLLRIKIYIKK